MEPVIVEGVPRSGTRFFCNFLEKQLAVKIFRIQDEIRDYAGLAARKQRDQSNNLYPLFQNLIKESLYGTFFIITY